MRTLALLATCVLAACAPDAGAPDDTDVVPDVLPACPTFASPVAAGALAADGLDETSGLVASRAHAGVWWTHEDSGAAPGLYAVGDDGADLGAFPLSDALALDWEDVAIAPDGEGWVVWAGDIGDNAHFRPDVTLWRIPEPDPAAPGPVDDAVGLHVAYPDGPHDAETLLADPRTGDLYVVTKSDEGSHVFRAAAPVHDGDVFEEVAALAFGTDALPGNPRATGGELSPDGSLVLIRTYDAAFAWRRTPHATVADALATAPCPVPVADEPQGEAIAFEADGGAYRTVSEGEHATLWRYGRQ
jgi:hypothetical protein